MGKDRVLMDLLGLQKVPGIRAWAWAMVARSRLRKVSGCSTGSMPNLWTGPASSKPARWLHADQVETFFDDTEVEVQGHKFEGARH